MAFQSKGRAASWGAGGAGGGGRAALAWCSPACLAGRPGHAAGRELGRGAGRRSSPSSRKLPNCQGVTQHQPERVGGERVDHLHRALPGLALQEGPHVLGAILERGDADDADGQAKPEILAEAHLPAHLGIVEILERGADEVDVSRVAEPLAIPLAHA